LEQKNYRGRQACWVKRITFGSEGFVREVKEKLSTRVIWREIVGVNGSYELRESMASYEADFPPKNGSLGHGNASLGTYLFKIL